MTRPGPDHPVEFWFGVTCGIALTAAFWLVLWLVLSPEWM